MKTFSACISPTIGDTIFIKSHLTAVHDKFDKIRIGYFKSSILNDGKQTDYINFIDHLGSLFFSDYNFEYDPKFVDPFYPHQHILSDNQFIPQIPRCGYLLNRGTGLAIKEPYLVITTKIRYVDKHFFETNIAEKLKSALWQLSSKFKIVIMGERVMEVSKEYKNQLHEIFVIYDLIKNSIPNEQCIDLTVPALGKSTPSLQKIQQDCVIMKEAKTVITFGIGGNFCLALGSESNVVGFRNDDEPIAC